MITAAQTYFFEGAKDVVDLHVAHPGRPQGFKNSYTSAT